MSYKELFGNKSNIIIGAVHFPPLLGFDDFPGFDVALKNAQADIKVFEENKVDAIFLENNYGLSNENITASAAIAMGYLCGEIRKMTKLPLGASVLWNDYEAALSLCVTYDLQFIRVPVFVDTVEAYCGVINGDAKKIIETRTNFGIDDVLIFTDIHVKHAKILSEMSITQSANKAIQAGSDGLIMTGAWTGEGPNMNEMKKVRDAVGDFPIIVGSGADKKNITELLSIANGAIVSTSLKDGSEDNTERNVKGYEQRISKSKVLKFLDNIRL